MYPILPISLDCPFLIDTKQINVREYQEAIKNRQSREPGNIGYTRHKTNKRYGIPRGNQK
jgi:hypothetical protein